MKVIDFLRKVQDQIADYSKKKFSGEVWFRLYFNNGGIRDADIIEGHNKRKLDS